MYWDGDKTASNNPWFNVYAPHQWSVYHDWNHSNPMVRDHVKRSLTYLMTEYKIGYAHQLSEARVGTFFKMLICIPAATVFLTVRKLFDTDDGKGITLHPGLEKLALSMGSCVFGIYLVEQIFREAFYDFGMVMVDHLPNFPATLLYCVVVLLAAYLLALVLKQIPGLKKLL